MIKLFTIGFAGKSAERFFQLLRDNSVKTIIDTRLHTSSQLSGFAKSRDLQFFLKELTNISYEHKIDFAPTEDCCYGIGVRKSTGNNTNRNTLQS